MPVIPALLAGVLIARLASAGDLALVHGHIYTGAKAAPWAEALSISDSRIGTVGSDREVLARRGPATQVIDLHGRTVIPGIVDAHIHVWLGAVALHGVNLSTPAVQHHAVEAA
jgi:predicted amidohydrolase YtcJ